MTIDKHIRAWASPQRILVATNLTDLPFILPVAMQQAMSYKAELRIVHVLPDPNISVIDPVLLVYSDLDRLRKAAEKALLEVMRTIEHVGIHCSYQVIAGDAAREIIEVAQAWKADRLIAGSHGKEKFHLHLLGSVAESLFHHAKIPVLAVGPKMRSNNKHTDEHMHIVFATSLDHDSKRMAEFALSVAEKHYADITFLYAIPEIAQGHPSAPRVAGNAEKLLQDLLSTRSINKCRPKTEIVHGQPTEAILEYAEQHSADMIILGASSHSAFNARFIPGTAYRVLCEAPCPVLVLKQEACWIGISKANVECKNAIRSKSKA